MQEKAYQILFVDQDEGACAAMAERLTAAGYSVISACCMDEGLWLAKIGPFDLYMFGHLFPEGGSIQLCRQIRAFDEDTPILFYFSTADNGCSEPVLYGGMRPRLKKAIDQKAPEDSVARLLPMKDETRIACGFPSPWPEQTPVRVAIIGLGNCQDLDPVRRYVSHLPSQTVLMTNGKRGVGLAAEAAARGQGIAIDVLPLEWHRFGRKAGGWSNRRLVEYADRVALFWDQRHREVLSLLKFAQKLRKPIEFYPLQ
jgi:DNA-binding NtrC family response regulator